VGSLGLNVLGQLVRAAGLEAVGGDRRRVDQPCRAGLDRCLEHVARPAQVHLARLVVRAEDDEGQVNDHVGTRHELVDRVAVQHVALRVLDLAPTPLGRIEGPAGHTAHRLHLRAAVERAQQRTADVSGGAGDGDDHIRNLRAAA
jgi:hypothetical protein